MPVRSLLLLVPLGLMCASQILLLVDTVTRMACGPGHDHAYVTSRDVTPLSSLRKDDAGRDPSKTYDDPTSHNPVRDSDVIVRSNSESQSMLSKNPDDVVRTADTPLVSNLRKPFFINSHSTFDRSFLGNDVERFIVRGHRAAREDAPYRRQPGGGVIVGVMKISKDQGHPVQTKRIPGLENNTARVPFPDPSTNASAVTSPRLSLEERCRLHLPSGAACRQGMTDRRVHENHAQDCSFVELLQNCSAFRRVHGYEDDPVTEEEKAFPLAFAIKMHTSPDQAEQLLRAIYRPHNVYCIHVDKKAPPGVFATMKEVGRCLDNVVVLEERVDVIYASARLLHAELLCMRSLLQLPVPWTYYLNLAGQEFPLKTNLEIVRALKILNGVNDIETFDFPPNQDEHYRFRYAEKDGELVRTNVTKAAFPLRLTLSKGSAYGAFSRPFVRFLLEDGVAREFLAWLEDVYAPEEMAWATLNTLPWAPGGYLQGVRHVFNTHASRAVIWAWDKAVCRGRFVRSVCIFGAKDLPWLLQQPQLVANKFHASWDATALDCLESTLRERTRNPHLSKLDWSFFRKLPHVEYYSSLSDEEKTWQHLQKMKDNWLQTRSRDNGTAYK